MSNREKLTQQGATLVVRDLDGKPLRVLKAETLSKKTWRDALRALTNDGENIYIALYNIAMGVPVIPRLPDGREGAPIVPSFEVQRAALVDLAHIIHGKPVAQTEVARAELQSRHMAQVGAMTDAELKALIAEEVPAPKLSPGAGESDGEIISKTNL